MDPQLYGQLIFNKPERNIRWKKDSLFNQWSRENWKATCRIMKLDHFLTPYTKIYSKLIKDVNVRQETIKIQAAVDLGQSNFLLDMLPKARETKANMNYWDFNKIKICAVKETINKTKSLQNEKRYLQMTYWIKG